MEPFVNQEILKRNKSKSLCDEAREVWKSKKKDTEYILKNVFSDFKVNGKSLQIDNSLNDEFSENMYIGYDCLQVSFPFRFTGNRVITKTSESTNFDYKKEIGAALSITTSAIGSFDIFLTPSKNDDKLIESNNLLVYSCKNPKKLTRHRIYKSIKQFLIFQRVDSIMESSSLYERVYVRWLFFCDARNREKRRSLLFQMTNHWGAIAVTAIAAWLIAVMTK